MRLSPRKGLPQHVVHRRHVQLIGRIIQHREGAFDGFTKRYGIHRLVWFDVGETMEAVIRREKQIKRWPREYKYNLIEEANPTWDDLAESLGLPPLKL